MIIEVRRGMAIAWGDTVKISKCGLWKDGIYFAVEKIGELALIEDLHPHQSCHTYATDLLLLGVDPTHARKLTGHQSEKAFRRYTLGSEQEAE